MDETWEAPFPEDDARMRSALESLELITDMQRVTLRPGDAVVVRAKLPAPPELLNHLYEFLQTRFPEQTIVVLAEELEMYVMGREHVDRPCPEYYDALMKVWTYVRQGRSAGQIEGVIAGVLGFDAFPEGRTDGE